MITLYLTDGWPLGVPWLVVWVTACRPSDAARLIDRLALKEHPDATAVLIDRLALDKIQDLNLWTVDANIINAIPADKYQFRVVTDNGEWTADEAAQFKTRIDAGVEHVADILRSMGLY